jgi:hypothetical protein
MSRQSITVRLPEQLALALARKAKKQGRPKSALVRHALERFLDAPQTNKEPYEAVKDLVGIFEGPGDLSSRRLGPLPADPRSAKKRFLEAARELANSIDRPRDPSSRKPSFVEFMRASPLVGVELDIDRNGRQQGNLPPRRHRKRHK